MATDQLGFAPGTSARTLLNTWPSPDYRRLQWVWVGGGNGHTGGHGGPCVLPLMSSIATLAHFALAVSTASTLGLNTINSDKRAAPYKPTARM